MSNPVPPNRPSLLWPTFAVVTWGVLLYQVYAQLPGQRERLAQLEIALPDAAVWVLANAAWAVPTVGLAACLAVGWIKALTARWVVLALVAVAWLLTFVGIQWLGLLRILADRG